MEGSMGEVGDLVNCEYFGLTGDVFGVVKGDGL